MIARCNPRLKRHSRSIGTTGHIFPANLDHALLLLLLLAQNVAKDATLLHLVMLLGRAQLIEHTSRNEGRGHNLRRRMVELLSRHRSVILEHRNVLEAHISLQVLDALAAERQILLDLSIVGIPQMAV